MNYLLNLENSLWRYERKYVYENAFAHAVEREVRHSRYVFHTAYPPRWVNNLYLDTKSLTSFFANVNGIDERIKCRIRWYGDFEIANTEATLEFKVKKGLIGTKLSYPLKSFSPKQGLTLLDLEDCFKQSELPDEIRNYLLFVEPVVVNRYHRQYFLSFDRKFRLTIDKDVEFSNLIHLSTNSFSAMQRLPQIIVELKYDRSVATEAKPVFEEFHSRLSKSSKYVSGITALYPHMIS